MNEWRDRAACADPSLHELFFQTSTKAARAICQACPVRAECLQFALDTNQTFGVWGGTTPYQRLRLRKEQDAQGTHQGAS